MIAWYKPSVLARDIRVQVVRPYRNRRTAASRLLTSAHGSARVTGRRFRWPLYPGNFPALADS